MLKKKTTSDRNQLFFASLDSLVPENDLIRKIQKLFDWNHIKNLFKPYYPATLGRPALHPVTFFKIILIQYLYGFKSVNQTLDNIQVNAAFRWFLDIPFPYEIPSHSTISAIYCRRLKNSDVFVEIFNYVNQIALENNLVDEETIFVDATHVKACANPNHKVKVYIEEKTGELQKELDRELTEAINTDRIEHGKKPLKPEKEYAFTQIDMLKAIKEIESEMAAFKIDNQDPERVKKLEFKWKEIVEKNRNNPAFKEAFNWIFLSYSYQNPTHVNIHEPYIEYNGVLRPLEEISVPIDLSKYSIKTKSPNDLDAGWFCKGKHKFVFAYVVQTACDSNGYILSYKVFPGNVHDSKSFLDWEDLYDIPFKKLTADAAYKTPFITHYLNGLDKIAILPYLRPKTKDGFFRKYEYVYDEYHDCYICPEYKLLKYKTTNRQGYREYVSNPQDCLNCPSLYKCTHSRDHQKVLTQHVWNNDLEQVEENRYDLDLKDIYSKRKTTIEPVFGRCKENHAFRYTNFTGLDRMDMETAMTYTAANLKKIVLALDWDD